MNDTEFNDKLIIHIDWNNSRHQGSMQFFAPGFFPCSQKNAKEIFNLIRYEDSNINLNELEEWLQTYQKITNLECRAAEKNYIDIRTEAAEAKTRAEAFFHTDGRRVSDEEKISRMKEYKGLISRADGIKKDIGSLRRKYQKIESNIEILRKVRCK